MRTFETGATRDTDEGKLDYEGFLSPKVLQRYAEYMHQHRIQADGTLRPSDNWQQGIPKEEYMKSLLRHMMETWLVHRAGMRCAEAQIEAMCGILFNTMGYMHECLKDEENVESWEDPDPWDEDPTTWDEEA